MNDTDFLKNYKPFLSDYPFIQIFLIVLFGAILLTETVYVKYLFVIEAKLKYIKMCIGRIWIIRIITNYFIDKLDLFLPYFDCMENWYRTIGPYIKWYVPAFLFFYSLDLSADIFCTIFRNLDSFYNGAKKSDYGYFGELIIYFWGRSCQFKLVTRLLRYYCLSLGYYMGGFFTSLLLLFWLKYLWNNFFDKFR